MKSQASVLAPLQWNDLGKSRHNTRQVKAQYKVKPSPILCLNNRCHNRVASTLVATVQNSVVLNVHYDIPIMDKAKLLNTHSDEWHITFLPLPAIYIVPLPLLPIKFSHHNHLW